MSELSSEFGFGGIPGGPESFKDAAALGINGARYRTLGATANRLTAAIDAVRGIADRVDGMSVEPRETDPTVNATGQELAQAFPPIDIKEVKIIADTVPQAKMLEVV